ncbi:hypothetical protein BC629DRAFT_700235 [Irpex lacteus]|nr:hypothetical protein BC629DRAFT_700235 [Irpex lacteus]
MDSSDDLKAFEFVTPKKMKAVWKPYQSTNKSRSCLTSKTGYLGLPNVDLFAETPFKFARSNKENVGYVFQTPHPIRAEGLVFCDPVGIRNAPSTPASGDPNPFMAAAVHGYSDVNAFDYFDATASLSCDNLRGPPLSCLLLLSHEEKIASPALSVLSFSSFPLLLISLYSFSCSRCSIGPARTLLFVLS